MRNMNLAYERSDAPPEGPRLDVDEHGRRVVLAAGDQIELVLDGANRMLLAFGACTPIPVDEDGTVTLDEAGEYRYRLVKHDRWRREVGIYTRVHNAP
jgi:hypothetical protein